MNLKSKTNIKNSWQVIREKIRKAKIVNNAYPERLVADDKYITNIQSMAIIFFKKYFTIIDLNSFMHNVVKWPNIL